MLIKHNLVQVNLVLDYLWVCIKVVLDGNLFKSLSKLVMSAIPTGEAMSGSAFDIGAGFYYNTQDVYFGLSTSHILLNPAIDWSDGKTQQLKATLFFNCWFLS